MNLVRLIIEWFLRLFSKQTSDKEIEEESVEIKKEEEIVKYTIKDGKVIFDVSEPFENYSQRNNEFKWSHARNSALTMDANSMCNVTSMVMALDYLGYKFPTGKYKQPEDNLCDFMFTSTAVDDYYKRVMPAMWEQYNRGDTNAYCPNLIHAVLAYATNLWLGCTNAVTFKDSCLITDIIKEITEYNRPVVMSGTFPYKYLNGTSGTIGHINCLVGLIFDESEFKSTQNPKPEFFIVDDPYGDWKQNFKAETGDNTVFSYNEFIQYYKTLNDTKYKMAHIFKNAAALI